jgi:hypothetical protein
LTREEALHYLNLAPHTPGDVAKDVLEETLFEHKKFLLTQNPVPQVLQKRIEKLNQLARVEETLFSQNASQQPSIPNQYTIRAESAEQAFTLYQNYLRECKTILSNAHNAQSLVAVVSLWAGLKIDFYKKFTSFFNETELQLNDAEKQGIVIGKEPDAMQILEALHFYSKTKQVNVNLQQEIYHIKTILKRIKQS